MVSRLQVKATQIGRILSNLERSYDCTPVSTPSSQQAPPMKRPHLRIDPIPPFNANRIRKSPSGQTTGPTLTPAPASDAVNSSTNAQINPAVVEPPAVVEMATAAVAVKGEGVE